MPLSVPTSFERLRSSTAWKRATCFWAFQVAIFAASGLLWRQAGIAIAMKGGGEVSSELRDKYCRTLGFKDDKPSMKDDALKRAHQLRMFRRKAGRMLNTLATAE